MGLTKDTTGNWACVSECPAGSVKRNQDMRCDCPWTSHEREHNGNKFCECPKDSSWNAAEKKCVCND